MKLLSLQSAESNVTMSYAEIGASFQQCPFWSIVVGGLFLLLLDFKFSHTKNTHNSIVNGC